MDGITTAILLVTVVEKLWNATDWKMMEQLLAGGLGGFSLAAVRMLLTYATIKSPEPKIRQFVMSQGLSLTVLPALGVILVWVTQGISGAFITGVGALGFILMLANPHKHSPSESERPQDA